MLSFVLNNEVIRTKAKTGMSLLHFIREKQLLKGTKAGCKEGDCGACTVLLGSLIGAEMQYESITSCLSPLGFVQGKHVVTVEGLNLPDQLTPVQDAINEYHGTQCGFCTPGFVVSMTGYVLNRQHSEANFTDSISGNICRCTGYKSIEKAGAYINTIIDPLKARTIEVLISKGFLPDYFNRIPTLLKFMDGALAGVDCNLVGGGTDLYVKEADLLLKKNVSLTRDRISRHIIIEHGECDLGAGTTVTDLWRNPELNRLFRNLRGHLKLISSEQIRNMATIGGNLVNASPIADLAIFFLALDASLLIENGMGTTRRIELKEFFKNYKSIDLGNDEVLQSLRFQLPSRNHNFNFEKVSKRTHLDIASVNSAMSIMVVNNTILDCHISIGGVAPIPLFLSKTSDYLSGRQLKVDNVLGALQILQNEISPISDVRGSAKYKRLLAQQLYYAHFIAIFPDIFNIQDIKQ